jgi:outer membrane protein assembly factor BamA
MSASFLLTSCNITKTVPPGKYLLRSYKLKIKSDNLTVQKGELRDNLDHLVEQKPNYYMGITLHTVPSKLILYNLNPKKYEKNTENYQLKSKTVERPVIFDSNLVDKSVTAMRNYLIYQGYFYANVTDTVIFKHRRALVTYNIDTKGGYLINNTSLDIDDSSIRSLVEDSWDETVLEKGKPFSYSLFDAERSRVTAILRDYGYYKFTQENISFEMDTANKVYFQNAENPLEGAINFIANQRNKKKSTCNIKLIIRKEDEPEAYKRYAIEKVEIYPDFEGGIDFRDSMMIKKNIKNVTIKYHNYYVRDNVIIKHNYLFPNRYYSQSDYDKTINQLSDLGIFQFVHITFREDTTRNNMLICRIEMTRNKKHYLAPSVEVTNGSTYTLGAALNATYRDINFAKGANLLTISANGGVEFDTLGANPFQNFHIRTRYYGASASLDFPKFIAPIAARTFTNTNLPHTIVSIGTSLLDRVDFFTLINDNASFSYTWRESPTKTWTLAPAFVNIIRLPKISQTFQDKLDSNQFLSNSYNQNFIEGENITYTFTDQQKKGGKDYSFLKFGFEEAGSLLNGINNISQSINTLSNIQFAQYTKFDFDLRHYFTFKHSSIAMRLDGGVGVPYGQSEALPYVKQYFMGGPYSLRGWRVRTVGPGSSVDLSGSPFIDRTGDIKLEYIGEYRFDILQLFAGFIKMEGALFADAGNIWLAKPDTSYPGGEIEFNTFWHDIAADAGAGARFNISGFFIVRMDVAFPIKKPYVPTDDGWVFKEINFGNSTWRADNLIINVAINYPF